MDDLVDIDVWALAACEVLDHWRTVAMLKPIDLRAGLVAGLMASTGCDDEQAQTWTERAMLSWVAGEGAVRDQVRALAAECLGIVTGAKAVAHRATIRASVSSPRQCPPRRYRYVAQSVSSPADDGLPGPVRTAPGRGVGAPIKASASGPKVKR